MLLTEVKESNVIDVFSEIENNIKGNLSKNFGEHTIKVNNHLATGAVKGMIVQDNKVFLEIDLRCHEDFKMNLASADLNPVHFLYGQNNHSEIGIESMQKTYALNEFQTAIVHHQDKNVFLNFKKNEHVKICVISVCMPLSTSFTTSDMNIHSLFTDTLKDGLFTYCGSYNLKIATQIEKINEIKEEGIIKKLLVEGMVQLILAMEIQHHQDDLNADTNSFGVLTKAELKKIQELGTSIKANADIQYSVDMLTNQTGIPAAKLQTGFKHLFGRTVTDYIKNIRLEIAEELIKTTDLNISEIVYSVGFSSRSYFSKIFREKYGCSPKSFQDNLKYRAVSA
ncbi:helix-turn-helix transcriptional regulator [Aquimarina sp. U1-2]|uniref:helix-turn-helix domain-containing protein n=1 Tax=Aquimarina sp. U1-2 TaxID=2823141 RepID=UPI001AEC7CF3|nr:helix-turn-helix transcriptional regulator [Aquimarina sp. U1-2]MBP2830696.1 helix-turn-helix transcriptional regulator [Aquimarina sp. U1-2]